MKQEQIFRYALIGILLLLLYFAGRILWPFFTPILLGMMLTYLLYPIYTYLETKIKRPYLTSIIMIFFVLLLIIIPLSLLTTKLVNESVNTYRTFIDLEQSGAFDSLLQNYGLDSSIFADVLGQVKDFIVNSGSQILTGIADVLLGLFVMLFIMFYSFVNGKKWVALVQETLPLKQKHRKALIDRVAKITSAVMYGQFLTSVIQGALGGLMFFIFGVDNSIFWGVIMIIFSFIPILGTPIIWFPASVYLMLSGSVWQGVLMLIVGGVVIMNVDNVIRPYLIGSQAKISTPIVLLGVLGGLKAFGFIGIVLGPLLLALLQTVIGFFRKEKPVLE